MPTLSKRNRHAMRHELQALNEAAAAVMPRLLERWLPGGRVVGDEYLARNPTRVDRNPGSFKIKITGDGAGLWCDFARDDASGRGAVSLCAYIKQCSTSQAIRLVKRDLDRLEIKKKIVNTIPRKKLRVTAVQKDPNPGFVFVDRLRKGMPSPPRRFKGREPDVVHTYRHSDGKMQHCIFRFDDLGGRKLFIPVTPWREKATGQVSWNFKAAPAPRLPYKLDVLYSKPTAKVIICEGEKAANAIEVMCSRHVGMTSSGGAKAAEKTDWSYLKNRAVLIWPDNDEPGKAYASTVAALAHAAGASSVRIMRLKKLSVLRGRGALAEGYDAADARDEGWFKEKLLRKKSLFKDYAPQQDKKPEAKTAIQGIVFHGEEKDWLGMARLFIERYHLHGGMRTIHYCQSQWISWDNGCYYKVSDDGMKSNIWRFADMLVTAGGEKLLYPDSRVVADIMSALRSIVLLSSSHLPIWHGIDGDVPDPKSIIPFKNGLLPIDPGTGAPGDLLPHTPAWISTNILPHDYDTEATCPRFMDFLDEVFDGDQERIAASQTWFGYCLTHDTSQQKMCILIGPPRSGKSTFLDVLMTIVGRHNVCSPTLSSLSASFGLSSLLGKSNAICADAHLGSRVDSVGVLEALKKIIGEDPVDINIKYQPIITGVQLPIRFTVAVNELPKFPDASKAMAARLLVVPFNNSFLGKEDRGLKDVLRGEASGICLWALNGLRQLRASKGFTQPKIGADRIRDFGNISSPISAFVAEACVYSPGSRILTKDFYYVWRKWCENTGHEPGSDANFGEKLRTVFPKCKRVRIKGLHGRRYYYDNIALSDEYRKQVMIRVKGAWRWRHEER